MIGIIGFEQFRISCRIGTNEKEHLQEQDLFIDLKVKIDFTRAVKSDDLDKTIDYVYLADTCQSVAERHPYSLLETLAQTMLEEILKNHAVKWVWICIRKPGALPSHAKCALVEVEKHQ